MLYWYGEALGSRGTAEMEQIEHPSETKLNALLRLGQRLILLHDEQAIAETVLDIAEEVLDFGDSEFLLVDESRQTLCVSAHRGELEVARDLRLPLHGEEGVTVAAARQGTPMYVPDVSQEPRYVDAGFAAASELAVPVQVEGRVLGVINVESRRPRAYTTVDVRLLSILASQAALALQNARYHAQESRRADEMAVINSIARRISATLDLRDTLDSIVEAAYDLVPCALVEISLWDERRQMLTLQALRCEPERAFPIGECYPPGEGYTGWVVKHREPLFVPDVSARADIHADLLPGELPFKAYLGMPLIAGDELIGTLVLVHDQTAGLDEEDVSLLKGLAAQAAVAIRNARLYEALARRHREAAALYSVAATANRALSLEELLQEAVDRITDVTSADAGAIRLLDEDEREVMLAAHRGLSDRYVKQTARLAVSEQIVGAVARSGSPALSEDMQSDARISAETGELLKEEGYRSLAQVPLRAQDEVVGTLGIVAREAGFFDEDDLSLLSAIGEQLGVAIANAQLFAETKRRSRELAALNAVAAATSRALSLDVLLADAVERVVACVEADGGGIRLLDPKTHQLTLSIVQGISEAYVSKVRNVELGDGIVGDVALSGEPALLADMRDDPRVPSDVLAPLREEGIHSFAVVPLRSQEEVIGTLGVVSHMPEAFGPADVRLLTAMGHQIGVAVTSARLYTDLTQRARELEAVQIVAAAVNRPGKLNEILDEGLGQALAVTGLEMGAIFVRDQQTGVLCLSCHHGMSTGFVAWLQEKAREKSSKIGEGAEMWSEQGAIDIEEIALDTGPVASPLRDEGIRVTADVPLFAEGDVVGILTVATRAAHVFTSKEQSLLMAIGHQLGTAIANAQLRQGVVDAERLAAVGRVAASVAHELRSPLGGIMRSAEFLARPELSEPTRSKLSSAIVAMARRLINTSQELLDFARGGRMALHRTSCSLPDFLEEVLEVLRVDFSDRGIAVATDWGYSGRVRMDADRMAQVVYNVAANARDAMPHGGQLTLTTARRGDYVELRFTDSGPGVPAELRERIFEPFVSYGKREGAGLGLAIAQRIVQEHDGEIEVESPEAGGAAFIVRLPLH